MPSLRLPTKPVMLRWYPTQPVIPIPSPPKVIACCYLCRRTFRSATSEHAIRRLEVHLLWHMRRAAESGKS
jgi:hypothetical protein